MHTSKGGHGGPPLRYYPSKDFDTALIHGHPAAVMRKPHALRVPTSIAPSSVTSSLQVPEEDCPANAAREPSGRKVPCPGGQVEPIRLPALAARLKPVLAEVHALEPHTSVNSSTLV